jgi:hypothetical protein
MHTAVPDPAAQPPTRGRLTLVDWMNAHRAVLEEEERLNALAARVPGRHGSVEAVERQRMRVQVAQDAADAIYDAVMQELRTSS